MSNDLLLTLARPSFSPSFVEFLATAEIRDIEEAYCENYKEAYGIKARWVLDSGCTREQWADSFVQLGNDIRAENEREPRSPAARQHECRRHECDTDGPPQVCGTRSGEDRGPDQRRHRDRRDVRHEVAVAERAARRAVQADIAINAADRPGANAPPLRAAPWLATTHGVLLDPLERRPG